MIWSYFIYLLRYTIFPQVQSPSKLDSFPKNYPHKLILILTAHNHNMSIRAEDRLQTIEQLSYVPQSIPKACSLGVVIDATSAYLDETKNKFVKKIKLVDDTYNTARYNPHHKYSYLTVFFYSPKIEDLPNPRHIGDLLYLRRFSFGKYNDSFQGHFLETQYCSWALIDGDSGDLPEYQASRLELNLQDEEKYPDLFSRVRQLSRFAREYLSTTSVVTILPTGIVPKDQDLIVRVLRRTEEGLRVSNGREELSLENVVSFAQEGEIAKLRSVVRLVDQGKYKEVVRNNFTSLIALGEWTHDAQKFVKHYDSRMEIEDEGQIYTTLAQLASLPLSEIQNRKYFVKVEVASVSATDFSTALKFYDEKNNKLDDKPNKSSVPVYRFNFVCLDESVTKGNKFAEIWLFSYDGAGNDFVERVQLEDLNEFSNYAEENRFFSERIESILNAQSVKMTVEVLSDGKNSRILRALHVG